MKIKYLPLLMIMSAVLWNYHSNGQTNPFAWGVSSAELGQAWPGSPSAAELLEDDKRTLVLNRFYRMGGENVPSTPTECRIAWNEKDLLIVFRCTESNLLHPAISHGTDWHAVQQIVPDEQNTFFPDKIDLFIRTGAGRYYQFIVTADGLQFGNKVEPGGKAVKISDFSAQVRKREGDWVAFLKIPWETLGGRPDAGFELAPIRTRWRDSEVSSPVAIDFSSRPRPDSYMELHFGKHPLAVVEKEMLIRLPSGKLCWQKPALLAYPGNKSMQWLWEMQGSLSRPTDMDNLEERVRLTQLWTDLLLMEGFSFRNASGSLIEGNMSPSGIRLEVNKALKAEAIETACRLLDEYLHALDKVSRRWFADGSPGNIQQSQWTALSKLEKVVQRGNVLIMKGVARDNAIDLRLSFPAGGGIRLQASAEGYFKPSGLQPLTVSTTEAGHLVRAGENKVLLTEKPFGITFYDSTGNVVKQIRAGDLAFRSGPEGKVLATDLRSRLSPDEVVYGFGEQNDRFNQHGNVLTLWGVDSWNSITIGLNNQTYKPIPVFHSSAGYSVFINSTYRLRADVGKAHPDEFRLSQHGPVFDYYFWFCSPEEAIRSYTGLTGKPLLPPRWAFEPWMGGAGKRWRRGPLKDAVAEQQQVVRRFASLDIPHSAMYIEGTSDNPAIYTFLAPYGIKPLSWQNSSISQNKQQSLLPEKKTAELPLLRTANDSIIESIQYVDFSHPAAKLLSERSWKHRLDLGIAGSMVDFGDRVPEEALFYDGRKGEEMHNFYSYDYHRMFSEVFRERRGTNYLLFGRAAAPGDQKWVVHFAGDHRSNFVGLQAALKGALNFSASGFSTWSSDLGGFKGWPDPSVYMRWTQLACFSPLMRAHGTQAREPWEFGNAAVENYKYYAWVRENLLDYVYAAALRAHQTGVPLMRSMAVAFPGEKQLAAIPDQYMFGEDLLVAPVITEDNSRVVTFPPGRWTSLWDGSVTEGSSTARMPVRLNSIPVYLKEGAVLPLRLNKQLKLGESMTSNEVKALLLTPPAEAREIRVPDGAGGAGHVSIMPSGNGFKIQMNGLLETRYLLIYDAEVRRVKVNDVELPVLEGDAREQEPPGWYAGAQGIVVRLPHGLIRKIEVMQ